jgi:hypothetical protein
MIEMVKESEHMMGVAALEKFIYSTSNVQVPAIRIKQTD